MKWGPPEGWAESGGCPDALAAVWLLTVKGKSGIWEASVEADTRVFRQQIVTVWTEGLKQVESSKYYEGGIKLVQIQDRIGKREKPKEASVLV